MNSIKIGSFNTKDNSINKRGGFRADGTSNADLFSKMVREYDFDLLGTQELTIKYVNELKLRLCDYSFNGKYRFGNGLLTHFPYNENNMILTKKETILDVTKHLPWFPSNLSTLKTSIIKMSIMPRIATIVVIEHEEFGKLCMINTHLDYQIPEIQIRQLDEIKRLILKYQKEYPVILTGDLNMEVKDSHFNNFILELKDINLHKVDIGEATFYGIDGTSKEVDHIFVPNDWYIENAGTIDNQGISDHKAIYVEAKKR